MTSIKSLCLATATGLLLSAGAAGAQQNQAELSEEEVRGFFDTMAQDVTEAVEAGEYERLLEWAQETVADEASFFVSNEIYADDERKAFSVASMDKQDMTRFGQMAVGAMAGAHGEAVQDYSLEIEVTKVTPIGPDAATVDVSFTETATLAAPGGEAASQEEPQAESAGQDQASAGSAVQITATADCTHLIRRGETGDQLVMGLSVCQARTEL